MISVSEMVTEGYKSLASRTLAIFEEITESPGVINNEHILKRYKSQLELLKSTGDIGCLSGDAESIFQNMVHLLEEAIPDKSKPNDLEEAEEMAKNAAYGYNSKINTMLSDVQISRLTFNNYTHEPNIIEPDSKNNEECMTIVLPGHENYRAYTLLKYIHAIMLAFQRYETPSDDIHDEFRKIEGYNSLVEKINRDKKLQEMLNETASRSHAYRFYNREDTRALAKESGMDISVYDHFLEENIPEMDFWTCYSKGMAYLAQTDVISKPEIFGDKPELYSLMSLTDTIRTILRAKRDMFDFVGIGLAEYMRINPSDADEMRTSSDFHEKLSRTYFS